jgi:hypothetical protein
VAAAVLAWDADVAMAAPTTTPAATAPAVAQL